MENKCNCITVILGGAGMVLLLGAALDVLPITDNLAIFLGVLCFILVGIVKRLSKGGGSCCK